jgi:hypothetical protein
VVSLPFVRTLTSLSAPARQPRQTGKRPSFFSRVVGAIAASNRRKAEREIARFIGRNGGKITDDLEREIERF